MPSHAMNRSVIAALAACLWVVAIGACLWASLAFGQTPAQFQGLPGSGNSGYPPGSTPIAAAQTATTGGINVALAATVNQYTYLCWLSLSPGSATAAISVIFTLNNVNSAGPNNPVWVIGAPVTAAGVTGANLVVSFTPCPRSNSTNQGI